MGKYTKIVLTEYEFNKIKAQIVKEVTDNSTKLVSALHFKAMVNVLNPTSEQLLDIADEIERISNDLKIGDISLTDIQSELAEKGIEWDF